MREPEKRKNMNESASQLKILGVRGATLNLKKRTARERNGQT